MVDQTTVKFKLPVPRAWLRIVINLNTFAPEIIGIRPPEGSSLTIDEVPNWIFLMDDEVQWSKSSHTPSRISFETLQDLKMAAQVVKMGESGFFFVFDNDTEAVRFKLAHL
jgi:hypothetical protein